VGRIIWGGQDHVDGGNVQRIIVHGQEEEEPELLTSARPASTEWLREGERRFLLELRFAKFVRADSDGLRASLLGTAGAAIGAGDLDLAELILSVVMARDVRVEGIVAMCTRELLIECGEREMYGAQCAECGCTNARACEEGCMWIEPDLCTACATRMLEGFEGAGGAHADHD
jgi:hypothetical protein